MNRRAARNSWKRAARALVEALGSSALKTDADALSDYGHDESDLGDFPPDLVVLARDHRRGAGPAASPGSTGCRSRPCGARSGKSGGSLPLHGGVVLSARADEPHPSISTEDLTAVVEPGVITGDLMKAVEAQGLFYPPDPNSWSAARSAATSPRTPAARARSSTASPATTCWGWSGCCPTARSSGSAGAPSRAWPATTWSGCFVGCEGTLGVATEITLQLLPLPREVQTALLVFADVRAAARAVSAGAGGRRAPAGPSSCWTTSR